MAAVEPLADVKASESSSATKSAFECAAGQKPGASHAAASKLTTPSTGVTSSSSGSAVDSHPPVSHGELRHPVASDAADNLTATFCDAFSDDPAFAYFLRPVRNVHKRKALLEKLFRTFIRVCSMQGIVLHSGGYASGVLWFPPGADMLTNIVRTGVLWDMVTIPPLMLKRMVGDYTIKADNAKAEFFRGRQTKSCFYVQLAGTRRACQGQGLLKYNMLPVLERADREGAVCYLEATKETTVPVYERFGFQVISTFDLQDAVGVVRLFCMVREPQGRS